MRFEIQHESHYTFAEPVLLGQHLLRFQPRSAGAQRLQSFKLDIEPPPRGQTDHVDAEGNSVTRVWFKQPTDFLRITSHSVVTVSRTNPYDFLLNETNRKLPVAYLPALQPILATARQREFVASPDDPVAALGQSMVESSGHQVTKFLSDLTQEICRLCKAIRRETGAPWTPEFTLAKKSGACRDLTVLFVDACRAVGLAARFASGYQQGAVDQDRRDLHAWAEVYIPGAGWRGFDPTSGLAVSDRHVAIAASVFPSGASCVDGTFRCAKKNGAVASTLETEIDIEYAQENATI